MAFRILFVKSVEQTSLTCIFGVRELYLKTCELFYYIYIYIYIYPCML